MRVGNWGRTLRLKCLDGWVNVKEKRNEAIRKVML